MVFVGRSLGRRPVPHTNIMKTRNVKSIATSFADLKGSLFPSYVPLGGEGEPAVRSDRTERSHTSSVQRPRHSSSLRDGCVDSDSDDGSGSGVSISMPAAAAFTTVTQPALPTDSSEAAAPAPDGVTVWGGRMADGTLNRFGAESAGGIEAEVD